MSSVIFHPVRQVKLLLIPLDIQHLLCSMGEQSTGQRAGKLGCDVVSEGTTISDAPTENSAQNAEVGEFCCDLYKGKLNSVVLCCVQVRHWLCPLGNAAWEESSSNTRRLSSVLFCLACCAQRRPLVIAFSFYEMT